MTANPILVHYLRGTTIESQHRGAVAVLDATGAVHTQAGDIDRPVFPRSAVKLIQAIPLVASGAADHWALSDEELALACASHAGSEQHTRVAHSMVRKAGMDPRSLACGAHWPSDLGAYQALLRQGAQPCALHNNCSGKHAGFLCLASHWAHQAHMEDVEAFVRGYVHPEHRVMQEVKATLQALTDWDLLSTPWGIDGCSIPTYAIPLRQLAHAFARIASGQGMTLPHAQATRRLRQAVARAPHMVAGDDEFDTRVMRLFGERVCCKVGAEGVYCAALPDLGLGIALKMDDGNNSRAAEVAMAEVLQQLLRPAGEEAALLASLAAPTLTNWNGLAVGSMRAMIDLPGAAM